MKRPAPAMLLLLAALTLACGTGGGKGWNVLLVTIDTLRADAVGALGRPDAYTTNLDRLASEGVLFTDARTAVPITLPSHTTLFTGLYPASHGVRHNGISLPEKLVTLAEQLTAAGYQTAAFVGSHVLLGSYRIAQGFDHYDDRFSGAPGSVVGLHGAWERPADKVTDSFLEWFAGRDADRPFFAFVHFYDPHAPYTPPDPLGEAPSGPYGGEAIFADRQLGRILDELRLSGLDDKTVVIVLADHGEALGEHGESTHGLLLYENTLSVPWIVRYPGGPRGKMVGAPASLADFRPTLTALLELSPDAAWQGESLLPIIDGAEEGDPNRPLYSESYYGAIGYDWAPLYALHTGPWKLVEGDWPQLFNLRDDPRELHDLAASDEGEVRRLGRMLERTRDAQEVAEKEDDGPALSAEQREALQALGYVTSGGNIDREFKPDPRAVHEAHEMIVKGRSQYLEGEYEEAAALYRGAIAMDSLNVPAMLSLADCCKATGSKTEEESLYVRVLSIDDGSAPAWCNLGVLLERRGDIDGAMDCYDRSVAAESTFAMAHLNRANLLLADDKWDEAKRAYHMALRSSPSMAAAHFGLAFVFRHENDLDSLVYRLKLAVRFDPNLQKASDWLETLRRAGESGGGEEGIGGY